VTGLATRRPTPFRCGKVKRSRNLRRRPARSTPRGDMCKPEQAAYQVAVGRGATSSASRARRCRFRSTPCSPQSSATLQRYQAALTNAKALATWRAARSNNASESRSARSRSRWAPSMHPRAGRTTSAACKAWNSRRFRRPCRQRRWGGVGAHGRPTGDQPIRGRLGGDYVAKLRNFVRTTRPVPSHQGEDTAILPSIRPPRSDRAVLDASPEPPDELGRPEPVLERELAAHALQ